LRRIVWSPQAAATYRREILDSLDQGEAALRRVRDDIERTIEVLAERPIGRPGRIAGTYEKSTAGRPYVITYGLLTRTTGEADDVLILQIRAALR
jgi:plasmid stabilization system protein ParE